MRAKNGTGVGNPVTCMRKGSACAYTDLRAMAYKLAIEFDPSVSSVLIDGEQYVSTKVGKDIVFVPAKESSQRLVRHRVIPVLLALQMYQVLPMHAYVEVAMFMRAAVGERYSTRRGRFWCVGGGDGGAAAVTEGRARARHRSEVLCQSRHGAHL